MKGQGISVVVVNRLAELVAQKERRERRKISQLNIAEESGVPIGTVNSWMQNKTTRFDAKTIKAFCEWLPCRIGDLLVIEEVVGEEDTSPGNHMALLTINRATVPVTP